MLALLAGLAAAASANPRPATAQERATSSANVAAARRHFDKARTDYAQGSYREAIAELEAAHALDPSAKDLVFNLGVVHEKLSDIDDALQWFQLYTTMTLTPAGARPGGRVHPAPRGREEGAGAAPARSRLPPARPGRPVALGERRCVPMAPPPPRPRATVASTRATIAAVSVTGAALVFGTVMAVKAKVDQPRPAFVTGRDGTYLGTSEPHGHCAPRGDLRRRGLRAVDRGGHHRCGPVFRADRATPSAASAPRPSTVSRDASHGRRRR